MLRREPQGSESDDDIESKDDDAELDQESFLDDDGEHVDLREEVSDDVRDDVT